MGKVKDLTGQSFGRLTVVKQIGFGNKNKHGSRYAKWFCGNARRREVTE